VVIRRYGPAGVIAVAATPHEGSRSEALNRVPADVARVAAAELPRNARIEVWTPSGQPSRQVVRESKQLGPFLADTMQSVRNAWGASKALFDAERESAKARRSWARRQSGRTGIEVARAAAWSVCRHV
jgi:hypothetical protein